MKILLINEKYKYSGAEEHVRLEKKILEKEGHEVHLITFDNNFNCCEKNHLNIQINYNYAEKILYKFFINKNLYNLLFRRISEINPDIIHLHNHHTSPVTIYKLIENRAAIQTIHDYSAICPKGVCIDNGYNVCTGYLKNNCIKKCFKGNISLPIKLFMITRINNIRKQNIKMFLCPSKTLTYLSLLNRFNSVKLNNPIEFDLINNNTINNYKFNNKKIYLYFGIINKAKGVLQLLKAFSQFSKNREVILYLLGRFESTEMKKLVRPYFNNKIKYLGVLPHDKVFDVLSKTYAVVVPSLWMENYATTILESLAAKCLVIGSNRGGIPEMIEDKRFLFDVLNTKDIVNKLIASYELRDNEYIDIVENNYKKTLLKNSTNKFYKKFMNLIDINF